ncbi:DUF4236 domain-containing protein [Bacillus cereus group sp. Bc252]|uniref:DUF4236 domain-containing protein n=1 Tax=Bacillus cereus group sp. Bc252 TaxID=3018104 RepID=UPI0022E5ACB2|nr:DUF4236 domain-containing protein [Bacillus cereus group sp. Bc252]MDA2163843.1 DUF4236 domain-containing protein [Bacillus cereus group sp. Bc252]
MGFKFRKSIKVAPGVKVNVTHKGVGVSAGVKGARISTGPSGSRITTSLPGTGISYEQRIGKKKGSKQGTSTTTQHAVPSSSASNKQLQTRVKSSPSKREVKTFKVTPILLKDSKTNSIGRRLMKPLSIITGICAVLFLLMLLIVPALILAFISCLCYINIKTPNVATCPNCNCTNVLISREKKITCRNCKSTLLIQK